MVHALAGREELKYANSSCPPSSRPSQRYPSQAGGFYFGFGGDHRWGVHHRGYVTHYYGHQRHSFWKKIKRYDKWGNLIVKRVKICR